MTLDDELRAKVKAMVAGMKHTDRESLALTLAQEAAGEAVQFVQCDRGTLTGWFPRGRQARAAGLSQADRDLCRRVGSNPERVAAMTDETTYREWLALNEQVPHGPASRPPEQDPTFPESAAPMTEAETAELNRMREAALHGYVNWTSEQRTRFSRLLDKANEARQRIPYQGGDAA